jgi:hypothetical protein
VPPDLWSACDSPISPIGPISPMECRDTCGAIRAGRPYQHDVTRQCMGPQGH